MRKRLCIYEKDHLGEGDTMKSNLDLPGFSRHEAKDRDRRGKTRTNERSTSGSSERVRAVVEH